MESREKCEQIIQIFNGTQLPGAKDPLLVKFADGGSKKKNAFKNQNDPNTRTWREVTEVCVPHRHEYHRPISAPSILSINSIHLRQCSFISAHSFTDNAGYSSCV